MKITILVKCEERDEGAGQTLGHVLRRIADDWNPQPQRHGDIESAYALTEGSSWYSLEGEKTRRLSPDGSGAVAPVELRVL